VEAIVQAIGGHRWSEVVQRAGCGVLGNLAVNAETAVKIRAEVGGRGGGIEHHDRCL
jgi:hypothetical protein